MRINSDQYMDASLERIETARRLFEARDYVSAIYLAGLAVECMLRAYRTREEAEFDSRHDLQDLFKKSTILEFVPQGATREFGEHFGQVWSRWKNDYRFASKERLKVQFKRLKLDRGIKGDYLKENCRIVIDSAFAIITVGGQHWN